MARRRRKTRTAPLDQPPRGPAQLAALWDRYHRTRSVRTRNRLVAYYRPAAHCVATRLIDALPKHVDRDEMTSAVDGALVWLVERFDPLKQPEFGAYMRGRLAGAILDAARDADHLSRHYRAKQTEHAAKVSDLQQSLGRRATPQEIEDYAGPPVPAPAVLSLDEPVTTDGAHAAADLLPAKPARRSNDDFWKDVLGRLTFDELLIVGLHYRCHCTQLAIGRLLGYSASRVSQIIRAAVRRIRLLAASDPAVLAAIREHFSGTGR